MELLRYVTLGQYVPGESLLHRLDPRAKLLGLVVFTVTLFCLHSGGGLAVLGLLLLLPILRSGIRPGFFFSGLRPLLPLLLLTAGYHAFFTPGTSLGGGLTREGLERGGVFCLRMVYLLLATSLLSLTTSPIAFCDGLERLLTPFSWLGLPTRELALVASISLRFVPTLALEADKIMKAQLARGAPLDRGNPLVRARAHASVLVPLFVRAFRYADDLATAMEARGYRGSAGRTRLRELRWNAVDSAFASVGLALALLLIGLER